MNFDVIRYRNGTLRYLDQRCLPDKVIYRKTADYRRVIAAIQTLSIRGAPLIGAAGGYAVALAARECFKARGGGLTRLEKAAGEIAAARPTAVNLAWAVKRVLGTAARAGKSGRGRTRIDAVSLISAVDEEAGRIESEDRDACAAIGAVGTRLLLPLNKGPLNILTHCNAGALATCGIGTALGVVRGLHAAGRLARVYADETRPLGQGARLTAWELLHDGIPVTVQTDSMAASLMAAGRIDAVVVGADRIARNGDTANKIGTLPLALAAAHFGVPFFVAAPFSTFDPDCRNGAAIPIEMRAAAEIPAAAGAAIFNPAFDVTPARFIRAFITERGAFAPRHTARQLSAQMR